MLKSHIAIEVRVTGHDALVDVFGDLVKAVEVMGARSPGSRVRDAVGVEERW